jgi:ATP-dependent Clp protease adaptor protein ClpS
MSVTEIRRAEGTRTGSEAKPDHPWNVILHNDWENTMPEVVVILKTVIPGMTLKKPPRSCGKLTLRARPCEELPQGVSRAL